MELLGIVLAVILLPLAVLSALMFAAITVTAVVAVFSK